MHDEAAVSRRGTRYRTLSCGLLLHRVPDDLVHRDLGPQMTRHVSRDWWAVVMYADGRGLAFGETDTSQPPGIHVLDWMAKAAVALNRDMHADGHWVVAFNQAEQYPMALWRDRDGHLHVAIELAADVRDPRGLDAINKARLLEIADEALATHRARVGELELQPWQVLGPDGQPIAGRLHRGAKPH